ncbi:MAG: class I SAM-dependent methyltransferase [Candidatus Paceibacteria bacterium]
MHGLGYDLSSEAISQAQQALKTRHPTSGFKGEYEKLRLQFEVRDIREPIPLPDGSVTIALDMMASHVLKRAEREALRAELYRVLKPDGWLFFKTFLRDGDKNAEELLREFPAEEDGMYLHPRIKAAEYVWWERDIHEFFEPYFTVHKLERSHKHIDKRGRAWKRRTASVYLEKQ